MGADKAGQGEARRCWMAGVLVGEFVLCVVSDYLVEAIVYLECTAELRREFIQSLEERMLRVISGSHKGLFGVFVFL